MNLPFSILSTAPMAGGVPLEHRKSDAFVLVALCQEDKEQLNRIEALLRELRQLGHGY